MEIGVPTTEIPRSTHTAHSKYVEIYEAIRKLRGNRWLPITFSSTQEAYNFRVAVSTHRTLKADVKLRGKVVYVRLRREVKNGSGTKERR